MASSSTDFWPQFERGYPEHCSDAPRLSDPASVLDIMPDERLIEHEWQTHGSCSGLTVNDYFNLLRRAFTSVKIPSQFSELRQPAAMTPAEIKQAFVEANHGLTKEDIAVSCGNNYLTGVLVCLSKNLDHIACTDVHDCRVKHRQDRAKTLTGKIQRTIFHGAWCLTCETDEPDGGPPLMARHVVRTLCAFQI